MVARMNLMNFLTSLPPAGVYQVPDRHPSTATACKYIFVKR